MISFVGVAGWDSWYDEPQIIWYSFTTLSREPFPKQMLNRLFYPILNITLVFIDFFSQKYLMTLSELLLPGTRVEPTWNCSKKWLKCPSGSWFSGAYWLMWGRTEAIKALSGKCWACKMAPMVDAGAFMKIYYSRGQPAIKGRNSLMLQKNILKNGIIFWCAAHILCALGKQ